MTDEQFLQEVKRYVQEIDPQAEVWLFGSRARGDAREDSDWDFLVLTNLAVNRNFKYQVWGHLNDLELIAQRAISTRVQNKEEWEDIDISDLYQNVKEDGKQL